MSMNYSGNQDFFGLASSLSRAQLNGTNGTSQNWPGKDDLDEDVQNYIDQCIDDQEMFLAFQMEQRYLGMAELGMRIKSMIRERIMLGQDHTEILDAVLAVARAAVKDAETLG